MAAASQLRSGEPATVAMAMTTHAMTHRKRNRVSRTPMQSVFGLGLLGNPNTDCIGVRLTRAFLQEEQGIEAIEQASINTFDGCGKPIALWRACDGCYGNDHPRNDTQN